VPEPTLTATLFVPYEVEVPYSNHAVVFRPFGLTRPFRRALVCPTFDAELVETLGAAFVVNERSSPFAVPALLAATSRKWYVLPAVSPLTSRATPTDEVPEPALLVEVFEPYEVLVPYSK